MGKSNVIEFQGREGLAYTGDSDHRFWFYSIIRSSQRYVSNSITVSDRIQSVHS